MSASKPERPRIGRLLADLPDTSAGEAFETLLETAGGRIERIVSHSHASPPGFWYDQDDDEWVMVVAGSAALAFDDGERVTLSAGDWLMIPAHCRHRVESTGPDTVWLAVHLRRGNGDDPARAAPT